MLQIILDKTIEMFVIQFDVCLPHVVGSPISVPKVPSPSQEQVDHYHQQYMEALTKLFHQHKKSCGLAESHQICIT